MRTTRALLASRALLAPRSWGSLPDLPLREVAMRAQTQPAAYLDTLKSLDIAHEFTGDVRWATNYMRTKPLTRTIEVMVGTGQRTLAVTDSLATRRLPERRRPLESMV